MISYELAKKLKDTGFPVKKGLREYWDGGTIFFDGETNDDHQKVYFEAPTLSELLKACGKKVILFSDVEGIYHAGILASSYEEVAYGNDYIDDSIDYHFGGPDPEELLAKLYLKINEK